MSSFSFRGLSGVRGGVSCWAGPSSFCVGASGISSLVRLLCLWCLYSSRFLCLSAFIWSLGSGVVVILVITFSNSISGIWSLVFRLRQFYIRFLILLRLWFLRVVWDYAIIYP